MEVKDRWVDGYEGNKYMTDVTEVELNWLYAYDNLHDTADIAYRGNLDAFSTEAFSYDKEQSDAFCDVLGQVCQLVREGATELTVVRDPAETHERGTGMKTDMNELGFYDVEAVAAMANVKRACGVFGKEFGELVRRMSSLSRIDCIRLAHLIDWFLDMRARDLVMHPSGGDDPKVETCGQLYTKILTCDERWEGEADWQAREPVEDDGCTYGTVGRGSCKAYVSTVVSNASKENSPFPGIHQLTYEEAEKVKASFTVGPDAPDDEAVKGHLKHALNAVYGSGAAKLVHPDEDCVLPGCDRYGGNDTYLRIRKVLGHKGAFDFCMGNVVKLVDRWDKKGDPAANLEKLRDYSAQALVEWRLYNEMLS